MVRRKKRAVKQYSNISPKNNSLQNDKKLNETEKKPRKVAKVTKSSEKNEIVPEVSHSSDLVKKSNSTRNTPRKQKPINVFLQSRGNKTMMKRAMYKEIRYLQKSVHTLIPKAPFGKVVREIMSYCGDFRVQSTALEALQESCELYLTQLFEDAYFCTLHAKRQTLHVSDINCIRRVRGLRDIINH